MQSGQPIVICLKGKEVSVDSRFADVSEYIRNLSAISNSNKFYVDEIAPKTLERLIVFLEIGDYKPLHIQKVQSGNLGQVLHESYVQFFEGMQREDIMALFGASIQLEVKSCRDCCASYFAALVYFKKHDMKSYQEVKVRLNIKADFNQQTSKSLRKRYPLLLNQ